MKRLLSMLVALPRAARWAVLALLAVLGYFGVEAAVLDPMNQMNAQADAAALTIQKAVDQAGRRAEADGTIALAVSRFGDVALPGDFQTVTAELDNAVQEVFKGRGVEPGRSNKRKPTPLGRDVMSGVLPANKEVQRIGLEVTFESDQALVGALIADIERSPIITTISEINIKTLPDKGKVQATIVPEAWIIVEKGARR
ncbi:MAG: hypothetical protein ACKVZJ_15540 [Phycisphaerales bacterium]